MHPDNGPISNAIDALFPVDGTAHAARVLRLEKRSVDRMQSGDSSTPPRIVAKLEKQVAPETEFKAGLEALLRSAYGAGLHPLVAMTCPRFLDRPAGGFPGVIAQAGGLPSERFISSIGALWPIALWGRTSL